MESIVFDLLLVEPTDVKGWLTVVKFRGSQKLYEELRLHGGRRH